ncbi:LuxR C-terminal-related transcriptional regulator [Streptomyces sp. NPDC001286]
MRIDLQPLEVVDVKELTNSLLPGGLGQGSAARLAEICGGNPRLLFEVTRTAIEQRLLVREEDCWHFANERLPVPLSVLEMVDPELRELNPKDRETMEVVARVDKPRLASMLKFCDIESIERLERRGLLRTVDDAPKISQTRVMIAHPLIRYTLSCGLPALRQRRLLHKWLAIHDGPSDLITHDDCRRLAEWYLDASEEPPREVLDRAIEQSFLEQDFPSAIRLTRAGWQLYPGEDMAKLHARALTAAADFSGLSSFITHIRKSESARYYSLQETETRGLLLQARYAEAYDNFSLLNAEDQTYFGMVAEYFQGRFARAYERARYLRRNGSESHALEAGLIMMGSLCHMGLPEEALSLYHTLRLELDHSPGSMLHFHADSLEEMHASALHYCGRLEEAEGIYWREYAHATERYQVRIDAQRGLALSHLLYDRGNIEGALKCATFTSSYRVGWRQWQIKANVHAALASTLLPVDLRPNGLLKEEITLDEAGHCAIFLAMAQARLCHERGEVSAATRILHNAISLAMANDAHADVAIALHECARLSLQAPAVTQSELHLEGVLLNARKDYAEAYQIGDSKQMGRVARIFAQLGAALFGAEAYAEQARILQRQDRLKAATAATAQARELLRHCGRVDTPPLRFLGQRAQLSERERTIASLAARGLRDKDIAERLCLSVRTVSNTLYRVYRKVGAANRRELQVIATNFNLDV